MEIRHDREAHRFEAEVDGRRAVLDYEWVDAGTVDLRRTFVPESLRGRGVGARLVLHALDHARESGLRVVPTCWFVARVIEERPEYRPLLAGGG